MLECSQCNYLIEPIDLDEGYYIEESLRPRKSSLHTLICLDTKNNAVKQGYASEQRGCAGDLWWRIPVACYGAHPFHSTLAELVYILYQCRAWRHACVYIL